MTRPLYFPEKQPSLDADLDGYLTWLRETSGPVVGLRALLLGGGYGRGEGGIFASESANPTLYNDLEFYLFAESIPESLLREWVHEGERRFGIEIEFKILRPAAFERAAPSMFYYDLLNAHILVAGDQTWVDSLPSHLARSDKIPPSEAPRLLVNRGMSLLRCLRWADGDIDLPEGFCDRITAKLHLALADSILCLFGEYHWSVHERHRRLSSLHETPPDWPALIEWHASGIEFKFHPTHSKSPAAEWKHHLEEVRTAWLSTFLWAESRRLGRPFDCAGSYAGQRSRIFPEEKLAANLARQLRDLRSTVRPAFAWGDHPRALIWKSLALLLENPQQIPDRVVRFLRCSSAASTRPILEEVLRACWKKYP